MRVAGERESASSPRWPARGVRRSSSRGLVEQRRACACTAPGVCLLLAALLQALNSCIYRGYCRRGSAAGARLTKEPLRKGGALLPG